MFAVIQHASSQKSFGTDEAVRIKQSNVTSLAQEQRRGNACLFLSFSSGCPQQLNRLGVYSSIG
jgi:hypothetical protein